MKDFIELNETLEKMEKDGVITRKLNEQNEMVWDLTPQARKQAEQWAKELGL